MGPETAHRYRACFVSGEQGLQPVSQEQLRKTLSGGRSLARDRQGGPVARLVIADCRLMEPGHPMASLLPAIKRPESKAVDAGSSPADATGTEGLLRRLAPWIAAVVSAIVGFLVFLAHTGETVVGN